MAEVTVKPYQPTLTPVDYEPDFGDFYKATGADKPVFQPTARLMADKLFSAAPSDFNPALMGTPGSLKKGWEAFKEGLSKSGGAALKSMGEALENRYVPEGAVSYNDAGEYLDKDGKVLPNQYRPNLLPVTKAEAPGKGWFGSNYEGAMPAMADVWNTLGGAGGTATLGAGPSLRPALKYMDKIYKAKEGQQHLDALPSHLQEIFQKQALSGEDISNFNFGFINHKGHFLQREDALKYAIDHGILDPQDAKYGTLVTTMLNKSGGEGKLTSQLNNSVKDIERLKRAKEQGYDIDNVLYHGSPTFKEQVGASFDLNYKPRTDTGYLGKGIYFTPNKWIADVYAKPMKGSGDAGNIIEAFVKKGNYKDFIYDENYVKSLEDFAKSLGVNDKFNSKNWSENFGNALKKAGYDGARGINTDGSLAEIAVFDPANIRSVNAQFDPKNVGKSGLLLNQSGGEGKIASTFFSALEDNLNKINQNKASGDQWLSTLQNAKGVKGEEIEWTGLKDFLAGKKNVTKQEIEDYLKGARVEINDVWKGIKPEETAPAFNKKVEEILAQAKSRNEPMMRSRAEDMAYEQMGFMPTKYHNYQLPGGENYRELLMTLPGKPSLEGLRAKEISKRLEEIQDEFNAIPSVARSEELAKEKTALQKERQNLILNHADENGRFDNKNNYRTSHWDEPNILAHMRMNDRTIDGKKSLHLEEIQSDWHQQGRDKGYKDKELIKKKKEQGGLNLSESQTLDNQVPDAPFKKTWHELALKRAIREAAENGYERLSWTPGEAQAARYDLSKQVDKVKLVPYESVMNGQKINFKLEAYKDNRPVIEQWLKDESELSSYVGKEVAERLLKNYNDNKTNVWGVKNKKSGNWSQRFASKAEAEKYQSELPENVRSNTDVLEMTPKHAGELSGEQLTIGGEGMKGFYDQIIPKSIEKMFKEFGVKVQKGGEKPKVTDFADMENGSYWVGINPDKYAKEKYYLTPKFKTKAEAEKYIDENKIYSNPVFYIDIPPAMRQKVIQKGQPLFSGTNLVPVNYNPFEDDK